jgi:hypothetical protein
LKHREDEDWQQFRTNFVADKTSEEYKRGYADGSRRSLVSGDRFAPPLAGSREDHCNYVTGYNAGAGAEGAKKIGLPG